MSYYDNIKDNVRNQNSDGEESEASFDTLKEAAQEESEEESEGNDTPIEVLEDGGLDEKQDEQSTGERKKSRGSQSEKNQEVRRDQSEVVERLDKIIDQNDRIIEILESFSS